MAKNIGKADDGRDLIEPKSAADWRAWLAKNHAVADPIWLVFHKKGSDGSTLTYDQAVEEALCFGWIDSTVKTLDERRSRQFFSRRKKTSTWSASNKARVKVLIADGRMTPAGMESIEAAKANGMWSALDSVEALEVPDDLATALRRRKDAAKNFEAFSSSSKKTILWWIQSAKRTETRETRIAETARLAGLNMRANHPEARGL